MNRSSWTITAVIALLIFGVFFAGCSDNSGTTASATPAGVSPTAAPTGALYSAGDIIKNPKSSSGAALLIIKYDASSDMYERAYVYPNTDGSFGYRLDSKTDLIGRSVIEKVYTTKVRTTEVSAIPIKTLTVAPTSTTISAPTTSLPATVTATTVTTSALAPRVKNIDPLSGNTGTTVSVTIDGQNFVSGANVTMRKTGETSLPATDISVTPTVITCKFVIPAGTSTGYWEIVVTNPDKQYHLFQNAILIQQGTATTTTTTTTTSSGNIVTIISLSPAVVTTGGMTGDNVIVDIIGSNLGSPVANIKLVKGSSTITSSSYYAMTTGSARVTFNWPAGSSGTWTVNAIDSSGNVLGSLANGFIIQ